MLADVTRGFYGLELAKAAGLASGTIYPMLNRLEGQQWLESMWEEGVPEHMGRPRRRVYFLTGLGARNARQVLDPVDYRYGRKAPSRPEPALSTLVDPGGV